jgi:leader peptidase (prepilin peptidase) / N-methyltransferase
MSVIVIVLAGILGGAVGSFLNVVIYRVPAGRSIVSPPSACPHCGAGIAWYDNIPVISWLLLRAKCRHCGQPISVRYPLVELGTAVFFVAVAALFAPPLDTAIGAAKAVAVVLALVAFLYLAAISVALTAIDLETHRLPNVIVLPAYIVGAVLLTGSSLLAGDPGALLRAAIGGAGLFLLYLVMALAYAGGMGFGDVKLAGVLGLFLAWLGWGQLAVGAFGAFALGGLFGVILLIARRAGRKSKLPFGPWMLLGAWVGVFAGNTVWAGYLGLFGLA